LRRLRTLAGYFAAMRSLGGASSALNAPGFDG
jgi:hypothetical protein